MNTKAARVERYVRESQSHTEPTPDGVAVGAGPAENDVVALQQGGGTPAAPHIPTGCSVVFSPGWEVDRTGGTAGLCQPVERDLFDCHIGCYWPAQVPDQLNRAAGWTSKCAAAQKDWRQIDLVFP
jgi:hypothetical protein